MITLAPPTTSRPWCDIVAENSLAYGPLVAGIDPHPPDIPAIFTQDEDWIASYVAFLLDVFAKRVGFVKFQCAYFEAAGLAGLRVLSRGIAHARTQGMGVIVDAKRGDIGSTAAAYANAYLTPVGASGANVSGDFEADCLTVNPLLGPDSLEPFMDKVRQFKKGLFILCRTSNLGADWLQGQKIGKQPVHDRLAVLINDLAEKTRNDQGLSPVGAVIGVTARDQAAHLRGLLPHSIILAPGLGAQGGDAAILADLRGAHAGDLLVPVSRGITKPPSLNLTREEYEQHLIDRLDEYHRLLAHSVVPSQ